MAEPHSVIEMSEEGACEREKFCRAGVQRRMGIATLLIVALRARSLVPLVKTRAFGMTPMAGEVQD
jgi:hypothetical protein